MNHLVKILTSEDGEKESDPKWCLVDPVEPDGSNRTLCSGQCFGEGEGSATFEEKLRPRGITCPKCKAAIRIYKKVKL